MCISQIIFHSLQLDCQRKDDFCCVCVTGLSFLRSFPVNNSVLLTGGEFIIYITFRNTGELPIRSRGRENREMFFFLESPTSCLRFSPWQLGHVRGAFSQWIAWGKCKWGAEGWRRSLFWAERIRKRDEVTSSLCSTVLGTVGSFFLFCFKVLFCFCFLCFYKPPTALEKDWSNSCRFFTLL